MYVIFLLLTVFSLANGSGQLYRLLKLGDGSYRLIENHVENVTQAINEPSLYNEEASASYDPLINTTGWAFLEIHTNPSKSNEDQAYAAGFMEGSLTYDLIYMYWVNTLGDFCEGEGRADFCKRLSNFIDQNTHYIETKIKLLEDRDEYWHQVKLFYTQIQGMWDGYTKANKGQYRQFTFQDFLWLNLNGDFEDLQEVLKAQENNFYQNEEYVHQSARGIGHCSALVKVAADGSELFASQETWSTYQSMLRIQKKYVMAFSRKTKSGKRIAGAAMTMSSYPGVITSGDDFYQISSGLVTMETTIGNGNASLWRYVRPTFSVFECVRSMVANRLATDGRTWSKIFAKYNSGTYNNQWMIVDYNKFNANRGAPPQKLLPGVLWVLEQIPNFIHADDMTSVLREQSYWPSYNVASNPTIYNISGNWEAVKKFGDWFTYDKNPRALIFKRDHGKVTSVETLLALMRYNDFMNDPLSRCDCNPPYSAENAIAARCDLNPANGVYPFPALGHRQHGATDAKVTSSVLFNNGLSFLSVSGPTYDTSKGIPPFSWSTSDFASTTPHLGHPDKWTFEPLVHQWA